MRSKPEEPIRLQSVPKSMSFDLAITLDNFLVRIKELPKDAILKSGHEYYGYGDCSGADTLVLSWFSHETDEEFALREAYYLTNLEAYNTWYRTNEVQIKEQLLRKEEKEHNAKLKALKRTEASIKAKQKQLATLKKELSGE